MSIKHSYIIADHIRASCFIMADGVRPSGKQRGYVLRRLIRRSLASSLALGIEISNPNYITSLFESVESIYGQTYPELLNSKEFIISSILEESKKYERAIETGNKEWQKYLSKSSNNLSHDLAEKTWDLYQTHGVPFEVSQTILEKAGEKIDSDLLNQRIEEHQKQSQESSSGQFKSGLGDENQKTTRLHTTTHLLHQVLREMFGTDVRQMGSAITSQKARFDFTKEEKLSDAEIIEVQQKVQNLIDKNLEMVKIETTEAEARKMGAIGLFGEKYGEKVTVYKLTDKNGLVSSQEFCGGPHVQNTSEIGKLIITKQKSIGKGLKRLEYDVVEN